MYRDILRMRVESAALACLENNLRVLIFCPTKRFLEDAYKSCRSNAKEMQLCSDLISPFHADMMSEEKQKIQQDIKSGSIRVVFTTNALELGLDIGGLDGVIMAGFPPSVMSAWQQIGRAGRDWKEDAFVLFYSMNDPIDRFFSSNLRAFLNKPLDSLVIDPSNEELIKRHLDSLNVEIEGNKSVLDRTILGEAFYELASEDNRKLPKKYSPQIGLSIRGSIGLSFDLKYGQKKIGQISDMRRFREAYIGAVFTFLGKTYRVTAHEERAVLLEDSEDYLRTDPNFFTYLSYNDFFQSVVYTHLAIYYGSLNLVTNFNGYRLIEERNDQVVDTGGHNEALYENNRHAFWISWNEQDSLTNEQDSLTNEGVGALEHLIRVGSMFIIPADRFDTSTYSKLGDEPTAFYYENYSGGIGVAKKLFEVWPSALEKGIEVATNCRCRRGCQNCIEPAKSWNSSNAPIDKNSGVLLARALLRETDDDPGQVFSHR